MPFPARGRPLTVAAVCFGVLAVSNFLKPLELNPEHGFVLLGHRLSGTPNRIAGPLFGLYLLVYAAGIWRMRRWAIAMGIAYAAWVVANIVTFELWGPVPVGMGFTVLGVVYAAVAIGVSSGTAYLLVARRAELV